MSDDRVQTPPATRPLWRSTWVTLLCLALVESVIQVGWALSNVDLMEFRYFATNKAPAVGDSLVYWKYRYLLTPEKDPPYYPLVLIGDSSCTMGIIPELIRERSGWATMNLATNGGATLDVQNELLQLHIAKHGVPRLVVMQMSDHVLCAQLRLSQVQEYRQQILDWSTLVQNKVSFSWRNPLSAMPSVRLRPMLVHGIRHAWGSQPDNHFLTAPRAPWPNDAEMGAILKENHGFLEYPHEQRKLYPVPKFRLVKDWSPMFERLFQMTEQHEFDLWMIMTPLTETTMLPETVAEIEQVADEMSRLARSYPRVNIHRPGFARIYPEPLMGDGVHMVRAGAERNSREIAGWLEEYQQENGGIAKRLVPIEQDRLRR